MVAVNRLGPRACSGRVGLALLVGLAGFSWCGVVQATVPLRCPPGQVVVDTPDWVVRTATLLFSGAPLFLCLAVLCWFNVGLRRGDGEGRSPGGAALLASVALVGLGSFGSIAAAGATLEGVLSRRWGWLPAGEGPFDGALLLALLVAAAGAPLWLSLAGLHWLWKPRLEGSGNDEGEGPPGPPASTPEGFAEQWRSVPLWVSVTMVMLGVVGTVFASLIAQIAGLAGVWSHCS